MNSIICKFCNNDANNKTLEEFDRFGMSIYFCSACKAEYITYKSGKLASTSLYSELNSKLYRVSFNSHGLWLWYVGVPGIPGIPGVSKNKEMKLLKSFNDEIVVDINLNNINDKIKYWLLFI